MLIIIFSMPGVLMFSQDCIILHGPDCWVMMFSRIVIQSWGTCSFLHMIFNLYIQQHKIISALQCCCYVTSDHVTLPNIVLFYLTQSKNYPKLSFWVATTPLITATVTTISQQEHKQLIYLIYIKYDKLSLVKIKEPATLTVACIQWRICSQAMNDGYYSKTKIPCCADLVPWHHSVPWHPSLSLLTLQCSSIV